LKFAAKFVNTKRNQDRENVEREIEIMKVLSGSGAEQKLIQLYDAYDMGKEMCLVLEIVNGGELFERVIDDDFELTERACAIFIKQICEGIEFIHSKNILHLDMKVMFGSSQHRFVDWIPNIQGVMQGEHILRKAYPENILCLSREGNRIKICDFGLARKYDPRKKLQVLFGTPEFVAPEVVNFEPISFGTDMWSIGVICYVLLSGLSPFMGHNYVETMTNVTHNKYDFDDEAFDDVSDDVKDFIERLLILDKSERLTPAQCYRHRWLRSLETTQPTALNAKSTRSNIAITSDLNENGRMSPDTETETTEDFSSSMDLVLDAKLDIKLTNGENSIDRNIRERNLNESEQRNNVIIVNVKETNQTKSDEINANIQGKDNRTNTTIHTGNINQEDNAKNLKRSNSDANVTNNNYENSDPTTEHFEKRKRLKEFEKQELEMDEE
ncbi:Myosin light chain kinase, smooth muscle, partial [Armadillidium nasatum]